jgi:hypothetical protein
LPPLSGRLARAEEAAAMEKRLSTDKNDQIRALSEKLQVHKKLLLLVLKSSTKKNIYFFLIRLGCCWIWSFLRGTLNIVWQSFLEKFPQQFN